MERPKGKPVLVCTEYRGVFFGFAECIEGEVIDLEHCRMAIRFGTTNGVQQLAATGPTKSSKIGAPSAAKLRKVTSVFHVTEEAVEAWMQA